MSGKIYILLPVHNRCDITKRFIESLIPQEYKNYHLVLIDDGSQDGTERMVRTYFNDFSVIRGNGNWWWAGCLDQGYSWLKQQRVYADDVVLIINDDTEIEPDYLSTALEILRNKPHTLLVTQCYSRQTKNALNTGAYYMDFPKIKFVHVDGEGKINCLATRGLFLRVTDMLNIGGFHPNLLPHYLSDIEYTYRAYRKGMTLITDPRLKLFLDEEATGFIEHKDDTIPALLNKYFSKKSPSNPVYWTNFILISSPWRYKVKNILLIWIGSLLFLAKRILLPVGALGETKNRI